jgi:cytochrome c-type biogenesis protein CcsB
MRSKTIFILAPWFMGILFIVLAMVMAFATFVEKDYGASAARYFIYNTWWFEFLFVLAGINIIGQIINLKLYRINKLSIFLFHLAFVFMIIGAGVTRYTGIEGIMHIREGESNNKFEIAVDNTFENKKSEKKYKEIPFSLKLEKFTIHRYPGSNSPSAFISDVLIIDKEMDMEKPYSIYMNHILNYRGYRFFQSSYHEDEKGTILSVSKDKYGIFITYTGYFLMILSIILSLVNKNSLFRSITIGQLTKKPSQVALIGLILFSFSVKSFASEDKLIVPANKANQFGEILVQDRTGRTEPIYTLSNDILRKISRQTSYKDLNPMQVFLGFYFDFEHWREEPIIKVTNEDIKKHIGIKGNYAAFTDFIDLENKTYKLSYALQGAYSKPANARNKLDKEIIKLDERLNICYMMYMGDFLKIFPASDTTDTWFDPKNAILIARSQDSLYLANIMSLVYNEVLINNKNEGVYLESIKQYQQKYAHYKLPSATKVRLEIGYYKANIFERLFPFYALTGFLLFIILIIGVIYQKAKIAVYIKIIKWVLFVGFIFHTIAFFIRWYISGHAPMSNGFETMIFISWVTLMAGFIFQHRSPFVLAATSILASLTLLVAHLSFMDPEITNLVPVLKSYWLTLHVSVITSSYAFFGMGAILAIIILVLYLFINEERKDNITQIIERLTITNYKSLTIGLYLLTIGTFLGAIWANESWGRYWGWDPKETWSLITIIVYSFVLHSRMIIIFKNLFVFNVFALVSFLSVLMTYFGVNYFLTGLHSYAGGSAVEIPLIVYVLLSSLVVLSVFAYQKYKRVS